MSMEHSIKPEDLPLHCEGNIYDYEEALHGLMTLNATIIRSLEEIARSGANAVVYRAGNKMGHETAKFFPKTDNVEKALKELSEILGRQYNFEMWKPKGKDSYIITENGETFIYLNGWEADSISPETAKPSTIGWLRNGEREGWFCVPWRDGNIWRGFFPDFLVVREPGERLIVDIIDPHDDTKPDAVGKAKGLSDYAGKHADLLGHIDLIAKIGTRYRRLHLDQLAIRNKVDALQTISELRGLYVREG